MHPQKILVSILASSVACLMASTASAQNTAFDNGEGWIILGIQGINGYGTSATNVIEVTLGAATTYRDATADIPNIINIGSLLTTFQGSSSAWYDSPDVFVGLATTWNNTDPVTDPVLQRADPSRTLYLSKARTAVGVQTLPNSTPNNITSSTAFSGASNSLISLQNRFESNSSTAAATFLKSLTNTWEDQNVTNGSGVQSTAYGITGGIQYRFGSGNLTFSNGNQEAALDFYRFQQVNDIPGQYGAGATLGPGDFRGIFTIDQAGNISFLAVPEPSSAMLLLGGASMLGMIRRRSRVVVG